MKRTIVFLLPLLIAGCELFPIIPPGGNPSVISVAPERDSTNVPVGTQVNATLDLPNGGINVTTLTEQSVSLTNTATGQRVTATVGVDNDAESLTLTPQTAEGALAYDTTYRFEVTAALEDTSGEAFEAFTSTFTTVPSSAPSILRVAPADGAADVPITTSVSAELDNAQGGIAADTVTPDTVYLEEVTGGSRVPSELGTTGGGDGISLTPDAPLKLNTRYRFVVTSGVQDAEGNAFIPFDSTFTTSQRSSGGDILNARLIDQEVSRGQRYASLAFGPDGNLYGLTIDGRIHRYPVAADGSLGTYTEITSLVQKEGGARLSVGFTFDPSATASNPVVWVTHTFFSPFNGSVGKTEGAYWAGKLTRLSGPNLETVQDYVIGLPRSNKDHVTNSVAFNPAEPGVLYLVQGSNTAMGAPDSSWGFRPETLLSGTVLRLDTSLLGSLPLNAQTADGGSYNPYAPGAPLTIYATGTRNSYDLVWHSNGNLYVPANGSRANGVIPRYDPIPGTCENRPEGGYSGSQLSDPSAMPNYQSSQTDGWVIKQNLQDYLFRIEKDGYYGTPAPIRCEWILNGGAVGVPNFPNTKLPSYPSSVRPDPNYRGPAGDFGQSISPNGAIEYKGDAFPELKGKLIVTRYSNGDDLVSVDVTTEPTPITPILPTGSVKLVDPLDIAESPTTGYLYVSSFDERGGLEGAKARITLIRP